MKSQQRATRAWARLGAAGLTAGLLAMAEGCASNGLSVARQCDQTFHDQTASEIENWMPGNFTWPPDGWLNESLDRYFGAD